MKLTLPTSKGRSLVVVSRDGKMHPHNTKGPISHEENFDAYMVHLTSHASVNIDMPRRGRANLQIEIELPGWGVSPKQAKTMDSLVKSIINEATIDRAVQIEFKHKYSSAGNNGEQKDIVIVDKFAKADKGEWSGVGKNEIALQPLDVVNFKKGWAKFKKDSETQFKKYGEKYEEQLINKYMNPTVREQKMNTLADGMVNDDTTRSLVDTINQMNESYIGNGTDLKDLFANVKSISKQKSAVSKISKDAAKKLKMIEGSLKRAIPLSKGKELKDFKKEYNDEVKEALGISKAVLAAIKSSNSSDLDNEMDELHYEMRSLENWMGRIVDPDDYEDEPNDYSY